MILAVVKAIYDMQLRKRSLKKNSGLRRDFEPVTSRYRCGALTNYVSALIPHPSCTLELVPSREKIPLYLSRLLN